MALNAEPPAPTRVPSSTWIGLAGGGLLALIGLLASGASGFLLIVSGLAFWTALYTVITGRRSWALLPSRKAGGIVMAGATALLVVTTALAPLGSREPPAAQEVPAVSTSEIPSHTASPTRTPTPTRSATATVRTPTPTATVSAAPNASNPAPTSTPAPPVTVVAPPPPVSEPAPPAAAPPAPEPSGCDPNYAGACVPIASDVDCAGGSGNGPAYVSGPVQVIGIDIYDLDRDGDGWACDR